MTVLETKETNKGFKVSKKYFSPPFAAAKILKPVRDSRWDFDESGLPED